MNDLSYNKAVNYENLVNNELQRRYNTLNMLANMYNVGSTGYQHDKMNWNVENTNRDIDFKNQLLDTNSGSTLGNIASGAMSGAVTGSSLGPLGALGGGIIGGAMGGLM